MTCIGIISVQVYIIQNAAAVAAMTVDKTATALLHIAEADIATAAPACVGELVAPPPELPVEVGMGGVTDPPDEFL